MVDLTKSLLDAIAIIADKSAEEVSSDQTIKAIVKKIVSTSEGKYLITYNNGDFYAYVQSGSTNIYQVDEQVYILVPEGDMSQKKFIIGKVEDDDEEPSSFKALTSSLLNDYVMIGDNAVIEKEYPVSSLNNEERLDVKRMQPLQLNPYAINNFHYCYLHNPETVTNLSQDYDSINHRIIDIDEESFSNSAKQAESLLIRAKFKANVNTNNIGHYGIIINVAFADTTNPQIDANNNITYSPKLVAYILDTNKMTGNPGRFYDYTSQYTIESFDGKNYLYIDSIIAFSEGFVNETIVGPQDPDAYIYIDNLEIVALSENVAINGDYKLKLTTPLGNTIKEGQDNNLTIVGTTTYLNQDISDNTIFYWGVKDPSITSISDGYNIKLGAGYKYLNNKDSQLKLAASDLSAAENIYICVATYESDIILKNTILLYNNNNRLNITINSDQGTSFQFNEGNPTLTCFINGLYPTNDYTFVWSKEDSEFGSILLDQTEEQLEASKEAELQECEEDEETHTSSAGRTIIEVLSYYSTRITQVKDIIYPEGVNGPKIKCKLKNTNAFVTYTCSVYKSGIYVGYGSITLQNAKEIINTNYYITITNGSQVFQYDENGIAPNSETKENPIQVLDLTAVFHSPQGAVVTPKKIRWIVPQENTLIDIPTLGLETDPETGERYFLGETYPLSIKNTYDNNCNNNQIIVVVTHADGVEYRQSSNLLFTKIGEIGTNGTSTVIKINELIDAPQDECLTLIKPAVGDAFYNVRNSTDSGFISTNTSVLGAELYTNNTQVLGHTNKWTIAGSSQTQAYNYQVITNNNNCIINYDNNNNNNELDTRIVEVQTTLQGKYLYSFYGMPAIEYNTGYTYNTHPIKIMRDGTLRSVLYDSNGENPSYNENQGVHVKLINWNTTGYLKWDIESGISTGGVYSKPNFMLSKNSGVKIGSRGLKVSSSIDDIQALILETRDTGTINANNASADIKSYINEFLVDIERIGVDILLSIPNKLEKLQQRLISFREGNSSDLAVQAVYNKYNILFNQMQTEYQNCVNTNKIYTNIYNNVQAIWNSEWPNVITSNRLYTKSISSISNIEELINKYHKAYDDRSNSAASAVRLPVRANTFEDDFLTILTAIDGYYSHYMASIEQNIGIFNAILTEYTRVLMAYLNILINETQSCFVNSEQQSIYNIVKDEYDNAYSDWTDGDIIGENIYNAINTANGSIGQISEHLRNLYQYYKDAYLSVPKYQIDESSETLKAWITILNGQDPNLLNQIYVIPNKTFNGLYMNNNVVGTAYIKDNGEEITVAKIYIPIIMTLNTYELAALNGWDGTNVEIGDDHIMTPQIGAGIKDDITNTFTGMVMGSISNTGNQTSRFNQVNKIGLIGYSNGKQSIFIDAKTGKTCLGLPEDDDQNTNEGRIILNPGGDSKIGNWKIGNKFLYNIVNGSYEHRRDNDIRDETNGMKMMVPHDKHGIILSAEQPYIHVKGEMYADNNLNGINYKDEHNDINPGDSLELRLDPNNKSLFSIVQHTTGYGNKENENLFFGYKAASIDNNIVVIKDYMANQNTGVSPEADTGAEYYIYHLATDIQDNYIPYYTRADITKLASWNNLQTLLSKTVYLKNGISEENFKKTAGQHPVFSIDNNSGTITYRPRNLMWLNGEQGRSDYEHWSSQTGTTISSNWFTVALKYHNILGPTTQTINFGRIRNTTGYNINKLYIHYSITNDFVNMNILRNPNNNIIFYVAEDENDYVNQALLKSEPILLDKINEGYIELFSNNNHYLSNDTSYSLKMRAYINEYTVQGDCCYTINKTRVSYQAPPTPQYGTIEITEVSPTTAFQTTGGSVNDISGTYKLAAIEEDTWRIQLKVDGEYDFVLWRKGANTVNAGGRTVKGTDYATFFDTRASEETYKYKDVHTAPTANNPWCISFYRKGYCTEVNQTYTKNAQYGSADASDTSKKTTTITISYRFNKNPVDLKMKYQYVIDWGNEAFNDKSFSYQWKLKNISFDIVKGYIPDDNTALCVESNMSSDSIKGIPLAKTYWDNNHDQKIIFYKAYYDLVASENNGIDQYSYIHVLQDGSTYYKCIKTLKPSVVNDWFVYNLPDADFAGGSMITVGNEEVRSWVTVYIDSPTLKDALNWKEFIRVGLDENGRLFSAGIQDQKTYSRTGKIFGFGKVLNLYGQEIRTQTSNYSNNYSPIVKIFAQTDDLNTTYITQGTDDNGNLSIRTAGENGYVELATSLSSDNDTNTIPDKINYIQVNYNGVQIQAGDNTIDLIDESGLFINSPSMSVASGEFDNDLSVGYQINNDYTWIKSPRYIVSSLPTLSVENAYDGYLGDYTNNEVDGHYRIAAFSDGANPRIQVYVGKEEAGVEILPNRVRLKSKEGYDLNISETTSNIARDKMELLIDDNAGINLHDDNAYIKIIPISSLDSYLELSSSLGGQININDEVEIKGDNGLVVSDGAGIFKKDLYTENNLYSNYNTYIGYNPSDDTSRASGLYLYKNASKEYVRVLAEDLQQLFDWYNNNRWAIGWHGNTVWIRNVGNNSNPEGEWKQKTGDASAQYYWNWQTFDDYTGTGI